MRLRPAACAVLFAGLLLLCLPPTRLDRSGVALGALESPSASAIDGRAIIYPIAPPPGPTQRSPSIIASPPTAKNSLMVQAENQRSGSTGWKISNYAGAGEIQGYAGATSVNVGSALQFYVSTRVDGTPYTIDFYRMGWYGGAGGRLMMSAPGLKGMAQGYHTGNGIIGCKRCILDRSTGLADANWAPSYKLDVPNDWLSGAYLALLTDRNGKQSYVPFVVRQDARASDLVLKTSVNTYEAYNAWGGKSLYTYDSGGAATLGGSSAAVKVSFNRPYDSDFGSGHFFRYEYPLIRWIEREGYDVTYVTDTDVAENGSTLLQHRGFISAGHDEYWTASERTNVEQALEHGVDLAFISGDAVYWQARLETASSGAQDRTLVVYRSSADPLYKTDPRHASIRWQDPPVNRPESLLTGTLYSGQTDPFTQDWVVADNDSWVFEGTGLKPGDHVAGIVGKEFDKAGTGERSPNGLQVLSHSPVTVITPAGRRPDTSVAESTLYTAPSGAMVFSAGTVTWSWGLDDSSYLVASLHKSPPSPAIQRLTQNLMDAFSYGAPSPP